MMYNNECSADEDGTFVQNMRSWRNWQTRTVQVRVGDHGGSNPFDRTKTKRHPFWMSFCFHTKTGGIRTREGMSVIRMSCEHSNSEWSEGDRAGSRGGSLQARRRRRSDPFDRTKYSDHLECMVVKPSR